MKIKLQIKNYFTGNVLFEYKKEENTIKDTLVEAIKQRADLQGADLRGVYLLGADLRGAVLLGAYLQGADLRGVYLLGADLQGAVLLGAYLQGAYLQGADLRRADLRRADLQRADLRGADLRRADLQGADLQGAVLLGAYLQGADLQGADLRRADLRRAYLQGANLRGADLRGAENIKNYYRSDIDILKAQTGALIAFKYLNKEFLSPINLIKLEYKIGETIIEKDFNADEKEDCGSGLNVATLGWCLRETKENLDDYVYVKVEFDAKDIVAIPYFTDGKFRVKKLKVLKQLSKKELEEYCKEII